MLTEEKLAEIIAQTVAPCFNWALGALDAYVKSIHPALAKATDARALEVARRIASEISEEYPRKPPPKAYSRVYHELEEKQRAPSNRECHACRSTGFELVHARRLRDGMVCDLMLPCVRCRGPRLELPAGWERLDDRHAAEAYGPAVLEDWIFGQALRAEYEAGHVPFLAALEVAAARGEANLEARFGANCATAQPVVALLPERIVEPEPEPEP